MINNRYCSKSKVNLPAIKAWGKRLAIHPDVLGWVIEIYAKSEDDTEVISVMRRVAAAQSTRGRNSGASNRRKRIQWAEGSDGSD